MKRWYEKYEKLNPNIFTLENWGKGVSIPPYRTRRNAEFNIIDIYGEHGLNQIYRILGFTLSPPVIANYPCVAIMFERTDDFEKIWWHYEKE